MEVLVDWGRDSLFDTPVVEQGVLFMDIKGLFYRDFKNAYFPEILKELYRERVYFPYLEQDGKTDLVIIDCGANVGLFTHYAYPFASKIYSIEPSKTHLEVLEHMVKFNKMDDKVTIIGKAISNTNGTADFFHPENVTMYSLKGEVAPSGEKETVETIDMEKLFTDYKIEHVDFMKLDVEGVECEIIGSPAFAKVAHKIDSMVIEWHTWSYRNPKQIETTLRDLGFKVKIIPADATLIGATRL